MDEAQIKSVMEKIKAAYWNRQLVDTELRDAVRTPEMLAYLFEQLSNDDYLVRNDAIFALAEIVGEDAKAELIQELSSENSLVRASAAKGLGHYDDFQLTQHLIPLLRDAEKGVRIAATEALESLRDPSPVPNLIEAIQGENRDIYAYAIYALYDIAAEYELPELYPYLKSDDVFVRMAAAYVLGAKGGKEAVRGLIDLVRVGMHGDKSEFERALKQLLLIDELPVDYLIEVLDERDPDLSELVMPVLVKAGDKQAIPHIVAALGDEDILIYEAATWGASQFGKAAIPFLLDALKSENSQLRINAVGALGHIQDTSVVNDLVTLLKDGDADVRREALWSLERIGDVSAVEHIIPLLKGSAKDANGEATTASYAAQVLRGKLATPEGLEAVERWRREEGGKGA